MLVSTLIAQSLRVINVPGQGAALSPIIQQNTFEALQNLLDAKSSTRQIVPGINTHFFSFIGGVNEYSYGPGGDFDTDAFESAVPIKIESAFLRDGGTIVNNQKVVNDKFNDLTGWTLGSGWNITNGAANCVADTGVLSQTLVGLTSGITYDLKLDVSALSIGTFTLAIAALSEVIAAGGVYEFTFTATGTSHALTVTPDLALTASIETLSVRPVNEPLTDFNRGGGGTDYPLRVIDQNSFNRSNTKFNSGRGEELIFSPNYPLGRIRFDVAPSPGHFFFADVLTNIIGVKSINEELRLHPVSHRWLRYQLAQEMAPEHGKELKRAAKDNLADAEDDLAAANLRWNNLRIDKALRPRRRYDINRGDF